MGRPGLGPLHSCMLAYSVRVRVANWAWRALGPRYLSGVGPWLRARRYARAGVEQGP